MFERRIIVVGVVYSSDRKILLCRMPPDRGVFPGQWGLPGGGIEEGETIEDALKREVKEEIGIEIADARPALFKDGHFEKRSSDGSTRRIYMIFLVFTCLAGSEEIKLNSEFDEYRWVGKAEYNSMDLNIETIDTLAKIGNF